MDTSKLLAWAQLLRLPNVFTAFADIALGAAATGLVGSHPGVFLALLGSSGCLYLAGMVWNDVFDRAEDARTRPSRPIPSGRVSVNAAAAVGILLIVAGLWAALLTEQLKLYPDGGPYPVRPAGLIAAAVLLYDGYLKRTPVGPLGMGLCRSLNVLLGLSGAGGDPWTLPNLHLAGVVGLYIAGVTWFARTEEADSNRRQLMLAAGVMLVAVLAGLLVPVHLPDGRSPWYFPYLLTGFLFLVGRPVAEAVRRPDPKRVQAAVKRAILGLVVLDAVLATAFVGWPGLLILLLLPPALVVGKWVYST